MKILFSQEFKKNFRKLPIQIQNLYHKQEEIFESNWKDSCLHTKKLRGDKITFSFRITRQYRVLFIFVQNRVALFVTIDHRKDIYR